MKYASVQVFTGAHQPFQWREVPLPSALPSGEVLVEIRLATVCGSDLHTVAGRRAAPTPCVLGHEGVGVVVDSARRDVKPGQRITWTLADSCGRCLACRNWELPQKCLRLFKYGHASLHDGSGLHGCYASHVVLRAGTAIEPVPAELPDALAAPANCALATVVHALSRLPETCDRALIQGSGLLGIYAAIWLQSRGVREIYCQDLSSDRVATMARFGARPWPGEGAHSTIDLAVELAGSPDVIPAGIAALRPGGHYVWAGMVHPESTVDLTGEAVIKKCLTIRGIHNYTADHLREGLRFLTRHQHRYPLAELVSPPWRLAQLDQAFQMARERKWMRVAVQP